MGGLNPVRFYGSQLPRPRIYGDIKFNETRVDPPPGVNAALLEWAADVPWKQGGTAVKRKRLQGKVEGRMNKLRNMEESDDEKEPPTKKPAKVQHQRASGSSTKSKSLPPAPGSRKMMNLTPIERMLSSPEAREGKAPLKRRILTQFNIQRTDDDDKHPTNEGKDKSPTIPARKQTRIAESDSDSDDGLDAFLERLEASKKSDRGIRRSTRLQQGSPRTPSAATKSGSPKSGSPGSKDTRAFTPRSYTTPKTRVHDSALESCSESESDTESSQSQFF